jgi:hypothetical protein
MNNLSSQNKNTAKVIGCKLHEKETELIREEEQGN